MAERSEPISRQHHRSQGMGAGAKLALCAAIVVGAATAWWYWTQQAQMSQPAPLVGQAPSAPADPVPAPPQEAAPLPAAQSDESDHPLEPAADAGGNPPLASADVDAVSQTVTEWLGRERTLRFVATDSLAQRIVASVDNLARAQAASHLWPLHPVGGRMAVDQTSDGGMTIAADNASRYDAVVRFVVGLDVSQASALYRRVYPVLQQAYEDLGYPGKSFNNRLVAVIDHLLQTPEPAAPLALKLVQVQGKVAPQQPWLRYEFADAKLQSLSAGQKILVRMGVTHTQRIKAQLREFRAQIAQPG